MQSRCDYFQVIRPYLLKAQTFRLTNFLEATKEIGTVILLNCLYIFIYLPLQYTLYIRVAANALIESTITLQFSV